MLMQTRSTLAELDQRNVTIAPRVSDRPPERHLRPEGLSRQPVLVSVLLARSRRHAEPRLQWHEPARSVRTSDCGVRVADQNICLFFGPVRKCPGQLALPSPAIHVR